MAKVTLDWYRFGHLLALLLFSWIGSRLLIDHFELNRLTAYGISTTIVTSASNLLMKFYGITDGDGSTSSTGGGQDGDGRAAAENGWGSGNPKKKQKRRKKRE